MSSVCAATWLWTNSVQRAGSRPAAIRNVTVRRVRAAKCSASYGQGHRMQVDHAIERCVGRFRVVEGRRPSAAAPPGSCRDGPHRWAGSPRRREARGVTLPASTPRCSEMSRLSAGPPVISTSPMPYEVRTPVYEGPFDLLLHLILREEVELWEVSLSAIVDAYLAELDRLRRPSTSTSPPSSCSSPPRSWSSRPAGSFRVWKTPSSTRSYCASRSATCCSPACSSARRSRTRPPRSTRASAAPSAVFRGAPVRRSRTASWSPIRSNGCAPRR